MKSGIVIRKDDKVARARAAKCGVGVILSQEWALPWERTLFIAPATCVPWDLVGPGFDFLAKWDAAAPLWRYGAMAADLGTPEDRKRTASLTRDLRLLVFTPELLFVRSSEAGKALVETWRAECTSGADEKLAFLRALYLVKPLFCALPRSWLADLEARARADLIAQQQIDRSLGEPLITVEISPGRFIRCHKRDKDKVLAQFQALNARRDRIAHGR